MISKKNLAILMEREYPTNIPNPNGEGSTVESTKPFREQLPKIIKKYNIQSILDAPCGDFGWMSLVNLSDVFYIGMDINKNFVEKNTIQYPNFTFLWGDIRVDNIPQTDLIICRDCLFHLSLEDGVTAISNFRNSKSIYLLSTTFDTVKINTTLPPYVEGYGYRPINLSLHPYNLGEPLEKIDESYSNKKNIEASFRFQSLYKL